jgi:hypothetical protein
MASLFLFRFFSSTRRGISTINYWKEIIVFISSFGLIFTTSVTTTKTRTAQTFQAAFHLLRVQKQIPIVRCSIAQQVTTPLQSNHKQRATATSVSLLSFLSILKMANYNKDIDNENDYTSEKPMKLPYIHWFQLLDSTNGKPFMNTTTSKVSHTSGSLFIIDQFRDAVKATYNYPGYLKGVASSDLVVYKNKAAFDAMDDPLKNTDPLKDIGYHDEHNPLIVVVPSLPVDSNNKMDVFTQSQANKKPRLMNQDCWTPDDWKPDSSTVISLQNIQVVDIGNSNTNEWIDTREIMKVTDFPEEYFVRKASIDIFNLLKARAKQIVLVGSSGVGKSVLLVLYSFWMAIEEAKHVLLVRLVKGKGKGFSITFLNGKNPSKSWKLEHMSANEIAPTIQNTARRFENCYWCLDGFLPSDLSIGVLSSFSVLSVPTSIQYDVNVDQTGSLDLCLVPFWSHSDLQLIGQHKNWDDNSIEEKYYYSGGSLRLFLMSKESGKIAAGYAVQIVDVTSSDLLKTEFRTSSGGNVEWIQMATVNTCNLKNYRDPCHWSYVICSGFALRKLDNHLTLGYFKDLCSNAFMMKDVGLMETAFENCFHAIVREKKEVHLKVLDYEKVKNNTLEYLDDTFQCKNHLPKGEKEADFEQVMRAWPWKLDYWYSQSRTSQTIDSIVKICDEFWLLQLTTLKTHSIDTEYLKNISKRLGSKKITYIAIVPNKAICDEFQLIPTDPNTQIPLRIAYVNNDFFETLSSTMD